MLLAVVPTGAPISSAMAQWASAVASSVGWTGAAARALQGAGLKLWPTYGPKSPTATMRAPVWTELRKDVANHERQTELDHAQQQGGEDGHNEGELHQDAASFVVMASRRALGTTGRQCIMRSLAVAHQRPWCLMIVSYISIPAGPTTTMNRAGKIQKTSGNSILTGAFCACSWTCWRCANPYVVRLGLEDRPDRDPERIGLDQRH